MSCAAVSGLPCYEGTGVSGVFSAFEMSVFGLREKTLAYVSVVLSSSRLPVGQEGRDGSLSAGLWLDPSPLLPRSTHTGNCSWQEVSMHPSPAPPPILSSKSYFTCLWLLQQRHTPPWHNSLWLLYHVFLISLISILLMPHLFINDVANAFPCLLCKVKAPTATLIE